MTVEELAEWAQNEGTFDHCIWVGANLSLADVKTAVRELIADLKLEVLLREHVAGRNLNPFDSDDLAAYREAIKKAQGR